MVAEFIKSKKTAENKEHFQQIKVPTYRKKTYLVETAKGAAQIEIMICIKISYGNKKNSMHLFTTLNLAQTEKCIFKELFSSIRIF